MRYLLILFLMCMCDRSIREVLQDVRLEQWRNDTCAASILYHESRGEGLKGQRAVYDVVLNRANHANKSLCGIMNEKNAFSWNIQNSKHTKPVKLMSIELYNILQSVRESEKVLEEQYLWFFSGKKKPRWAYKMKCKRIEHHNFCREKLK